MKVNITIPTYNRARCVVKAVEAALTQSHEMTVVTVVDDGSTDGTRACLQGFFPDPRFNYIRLAENRGTAGAKNASILLSDYEAITFHDSDDIPDRHKILLQARAMELPGHIADPINDWDIFGHEIGSELRVDLVFTAHRLYKCDGSVHLINKHISLLDDFFPNVQFPSKTSGDWILVNSALFRRELFNRFGGYLDSIEEDREIRNRLIAGGAITYFLDTPLMDKIEMSDSLTIAEDTNYKAEWRCQDRKKVWERTQLYRSRLMARHDARPALEDLVVPIDLQVDIAEVSNPELLRFNSEIPMTSATRECFEKYSRRMTLA